MKNFKYVIAAGLALLSVSMLVVFAEETLVESIFVTDTIEINDKAVITKNAITDKIEISEKVEQSP